MVEPAWFQNEPNFVDTTAARFVARAAVSLPSETICVITPSTPLNASTTEMHHNRQRAEQSQRQTRQVRVLR